MSTAQVFANHWHFNCSAYAILSGFTGRTTFTNAAMAGLSIVMMLWCMARGGDRWQAATVFLFAGLLLSSTVYPWYLLWALALVPIRFDLGVWVFGDNSGHDLRYLLYTSGAASGYVIVSMGPIDWIGWKLRMIPMSSVPPGNGSARRFSSVMVYQNAGGPLSGTLYFDDLSLISAVTDVAGLGHDGIPITWRITQNYPNPFNPSTTIGYDVPVDGHIRLTVWNTIGQRVAVLVEGQKTAGRYKEVFDASHLPSGTYIARLEGGSMSVSMKMVLLR